MTTTIDQVSTQKRDWDTVMNVHTAAATSVLALGASIFLLPKGTRVHRLLGRAWTASMLATCGSSYGIRTQNDCFSWIHVLPTVTLLSVGAGVYSIRRQPRDLRRHVAFMRGSYASAIGGGFVAVAKSRHSFYEEFVAPIKGSWTTHKSNAVQGAP